MADQAATGPENAMDLSKPTGTGVMAEMFKHIKATDQIQRSIGVLSQCLACIPLAYRVAAMGLCQAQLGWAQLDTLNRGPAKPLQRLNQFTLASAEIQSTLPCGRQMGQQQALKTPD